MAITITDRPNTFTFKGQRLIYTATSTNTAQTGFKFIVEVKDGATTLGKYYIPQNPSGVLVFDIAEVVREYINVDTNDDLGNGLIHTLPNVSTKQMSKATKGIAKIGVQIGEVYGDPLVEYTNLAEHRLYLTGGNIQAREGYRYALSEYVADSSTKKVFLTNRKPSPLNVISKDHIEVKCTDTDYGSMAVWNDDTILSSTATKIMYRIYDSGGLVGSQSMSFSTTNGSDLPSSADAKAKLTYIGLFPANWSSSNSPLLSSYRPINVSGWRYYTIEMLDAVNASVSEPIYFVNTPSPCKHQPVQLAWVNQLGGWDYFRMDARTSRSITTTAKEYMKTLGDYSSSTYSFDTWSRQQTPYQVDAKLQYILRSEYLSKEDTELLQNVLRSKNVMMYLDGQWLPIVVKSTQVNYETETISRRLTMTFNVELAQNELC